jgi:hypothetical protein
MARPLRVWWLAFAVLPALVVQVSSCSEDSGTATEATDAAPDTRQRPPPDALVEDPDAADGAVLKPPPVIPGCVGTSIALQPSGERGYVGVNMGGDGGAIVGDFLLDFGANGSTIDLNGFDGSAPVPSSCFGDAASPGASCSFPNFDFFGGWGTVSLTTADYSFLFNSVKQAGIIGTDFLSVYPFTIDYAHAKVWRSASPTFCTDAQLLGAGFSPIPAGGFYTNKFASLRPLSDVISDPDAAATAGYVVPNVPTVPITVAGASALAQLDTGYDDRIIRHSININQALLDLLLAQNPVKLTRQQSKDLYLTTCVPGLSQLGAAWKLTPGTEVNFVGSGGAVARRDTGTYVFVKEKLPAADRCGGIETWTVPAAQMGASFLVDAQAVVFDPISSRVWLPKD